MTAQIDLTTSLHAASAPSVHTHITGVGTANPPTSYAQEEILELLGLDDPITHRVFRSSHIARRPLALPPADPATGRLRAESARDLIEKFRTVSRDIGRRAIEGALDDSRTEPDEIGAIVCVTSTGFMVPGLSCLFARELGLTSSCRRIDVVGMGCNAGLNGLSALDGWARSHEGRAGLLLCCEVNSAIYCLDDTPRDGIVNSLFADGAAAIVARSRADAGGVVSGPRILDFECAMVGEHWDAMRFDWHDDLARWRFYLGPNIPYFLGVHCDVPVDALLARHGLHKRDVDHWIMHTGGGAVIDAIKLKLGLTEHDVRHTRGVLRDYGNLSSGSFLFSYERLLREGCVLPGDVGVMITMGPGAQIETALLEW